MSRRTWSNRCYSTCAMTRFSLWVYLNLPEKRIGLVYIGLVGHVIVMGVGSASIIRDSGLIETVDEYMSWPFTSIHSLKLFCV